MTQGIKNIIGPEAPQGMTKQTAVLVPNVILLKSLLKALQDGCLGIDGDGDVELFDKSDNPIGWFAYDWDDLVAEQQQMAINIWEKLSETKRNYYLQGCQFESVLTNEQLREQLAAYAYETWSGWMLHLLSQCYHATDARHEGPQIIPIAFFERWRKLMFTDYANLPESEKKSSREEAYKMLKIIEPGYSAK